MLLVTFISCSRRSKLSIFMLIRICIASNWTFSKQPMHIFTQSCMDEIFTNTEYKRLTDVNYGFGFHAATNLSNSILKNTICLDLIQYQRIAIIIWLLLKMKRLLIILLSNHIQVCGQIFFIYSTSIKRTYINRLNEKQI